MKNLFLLPTDKPSRLRYNLSNILVLTKEAYRDYGKEVNQHLYITSDEEIKKGDWCINPKNDKVMKVGHHGHHGYSSKKIILTTDQDLIKDGVQTIPDEFLEWFVRNPSCQWVEVKIVESDECDCYYTKFCKSTGLDYKTHCSYGGNVKSYYKITISKEESSYKVKNTMFNCGDNEPADTLLSMLESQGVLSESFVNKITKPIMICTTNFKGNEELINNLINQLDQEMKWLNLFSDSFRIMITTELKLMVIRQKQIEL